MRLGEGIARFVPERMRSPLVATSYAEFIEMMKMQGATKVTATPGRIAMIHDVQTATNASATGWRYHVDLQTTGVRGRRIRYDHTCADKISQDVDQGIVGTRAVELLEEKWLLTTLVTADQLLERIRERIPGSQTDLIDDDGPFTREAYDQLHQIASAQHIRPWD